MHKTDNMTDFTIDPASDADNFTCENNDSNRQALFRIERLAKDQMVSYYKIPCSALVFVLDGTVRVSTDVYIKQTVGGGKKCVRGTRMRQRIDTRC